MLEFYERQFQYLDTAIENYAKSKTKALTCQCRRSDHLMLTQMHKYVTPNILSTLRTWDTFPLSVA